MQFLEKLWKMCETIEILNLHQQKGDESISYQKQIKFFIGNLLAT